MLLIDLLVNANVAKDKSVARRLISQGMVSFNGSKYTNIEKEVKPKEGDILKVGSFIKIQLRKKDIDETTTEEDNV